MNIEVLDGYKKEDVFLCDFTGVEGDLWVVSVVMGEVRMVMLMEVMRKVYGAVIFLVK